MPFGYVIVVMNDPGANPLSCSKNDDPSAPVLEGSTLTRAPEAGAGAGGFVTTVDGTCGGAAAVGAALAATGTLADGALDRTTATGDGDGASDEEDTSQARQATETVAMAQRRRNIGRCYGPDRGSRPEVLQGVAGA